MDPLSIAASSIAIVDFLKESIRYIKDVIAADKERQVLTDRLDYVDTVAKSLDTLLKSERNHPGQPWMLLLDPKENEKSPLKGLKLAVEKLMNALDPKKSAWRQKIKNLDWHNEKDDLEAIFVEINGFCAGIGAILVAANIEISRTTYSVTSETNLITKKMAAEFDLDREETRKAQEQTMRLQVEKEKRREETERKEIERWLSPLNFQARQREILETSARTGKHFIESPEFLNWKNGGVRLLRCYGPSGAGKTILSAIVIDDLVRSLPSGTPVLCIYFEQRPSSPHTPNNLLGSLLKQLIQIRDCGLPEGVKDAYKNATRINARMTQNEMRGLLEVELESHENVYLVVDALDEASQESRDLVEKSIHGICPEKLKLMTTRREDEEFSHNKILCNICREECEFYHHCLECPQTPLRRKDLCQSCMNKGKGCPNDPSHELAPPKIVEKIIATPNADLEIYVRAVIKDQMPEEQPEDGLDSPRRSSSKLGWECHKSEPLLNDIVTAIVKNSQGRFLLAKQYTRSLGSKMTLKAIKKAVRDMQEDRYSLSELIDKNYDEDMAIRIKGQESEKAKVALRILAIISTARRNFKLKELQHALATEEGDTEYDPEGQLDRQEILNLTKGLVRIDRDQNAIVRLDHRTLEEYFEKTRDKHFPAFEIEMAKICLNYLNFDEFSKPCDEIEEFSAKEDLHALLSYAVQYWGDHVREAIKLPDSSDIVKAAVAYLQKPGCLDAYIQAAWAANTQEHDKWDVRRTIHALHVCSWFDLDSLIPALDHSALELDSREKTYGQTPLMYACRRGNKNIARRLIELGATLNLVSTRGRTALFEAVLRRDHELVAILLSLESRGFEIDVNVINSKLHGRTALMVASHMGQNEIVSSLLQHPAILINLQDSEGHTALSLAVSRDRKDTVKLLLAVKGIELNYRETGFGRTALSLAAEENLSDTVELLLMQGADPRVKDMRGGTAILRAAEEGSIEALQKLIDFDIPLECADENGRTPFHLASENGHIEVLELLKEKQLNIDCQDRFGMTPLHCACSSGTLESAEFLLESGARRSIKDKFERTPLIVAQQYGHQDLITICQDNETDGESDSAEVEDVPLWSLVKLQRFDMIVAALTANQARLLEKEPGTGSTAIHCAIIDLDSEVSDSDIQIKILRALVEAGTQYLDEPDDCGRSPLHLAALYGSIDATRILFEHDPKLNRKDRFGLTPLAIAFRNTNFPVAVMLIDAGANIPISQIDLQKMLFKSIELQSVQAVEALVGAGADATAPDEFGRTANQLARLSGDSRLMRMVQSIKSFMYQMKRAPTTKACTDISVVEVFDDATASQVPFRPFQSRPFSAPIDLEETVVCA